MEKAKKSKVARCANGACLEVTFEETGVRLTSTTGEGGALKLSADEWNTFLGQAGDPDWRA